MEETEERTEKRPRTDTGPECTESRQKKGQMKSFEELYNKTHAKFKDKQRKEGLWETVAVSRNLSVNTVKKWFKTQRTRYGKLTHTKSGQTAVENTNRPG